MINNRPVLALFFELNGSLELWNSVGFLEREIALYNRLAKDYFEKIYFFTYGDITDFKFKVRLESNIIIVPLKKKPGSFIRAFFYELILPLTQYSTLKQCDILKTNQNSGSLAATITKVIFPKKILVARSGYIGSELAKREQLSCVVHLYYLIAELLTYSIANKILIPTLENVKILSQKYPFIKNKITVHNNYIDTELFQKSSTEPKKYDIIYVGRMGRDKNHQAILRAIKNTSVKILFIGDGPEKSTILKLAHHLNLSLVHFSSIPNNLLPSYYNQAKICVFPSLHEGNPKALLEAMACELPVIGFDVPGVSTLIESGKNGILTEENTLEKSIASLLSDRGQQSHLGKNARGTVLQSFSFEQILTQEKNIYTNLLNL